ncbi:MAG: 50S ribosomal protein L25 [Spirochaetia bacterium]
MDRKILSAKERTETRKSAARALRRAGKIPAVIYGHNGPSTIAVDEKEFTKNFRTVSENTIINIKTDSSDYDVLVKAHQEDIITGQILHIDFYEIEQGKVLRTHAPIRTVGTAPGVKQGGVFENPLYEMEIECLPKDLPEEIVVDVSELNIGEAVHVEDIEPSEGVKFLNPPEQVVAIVSVLKEEVEEEEEEEDLELEEGEAGAEEEESEE